MRHLTKMTLLAVALMSLTGCCRGWPRWLCRGDSCAPTCGTYEGTELGTTPALLAPSIIPARPTELPGPAANPQ